MHILVRSCCLASEIAKAASEMREDVAFSVQERLNGVAKKVSIDFWYVLVVVLIGEYKREVR